MTEGPHQAPRKTSPSSSRLSAGFRTYLRNARSSLTQSFHRKGGPKVGDVPALDLDAAGSDLGGSEPLCLNCEKIAQFFRRHHVGGYRTDEVGVLGDFKRQIHCLTCQNLAECLNHKSQDDPTKIYVLREDDSVEAYASDKSIGFKCGKDTLFLAHNNPSQFPKDAEAVSVDSLDPQWIDLDRVKKWVAICDRRHHGKCHTIADPWLTIKPPELMFLIDVKRQCLVLSQASYQYIALSYVWGSHKEPFQTTVENVEELCNTGSFSKPTNMERLPKTIKDSMALTKLLGRRYLWVDRFCIVQNDEKHKSSQIMAMASIYAYAYLTIVAGDGSDDNFGIRGIPHTSVPRESPFRKLCFAPDVRMTNLFPLREPRKYDTRGWTFQEFAMSRRKLHFRNGAVEWICVQLSQKEHMVEQVELEPHHLSSILPLRPWPDIQLYSRLVNEYTCRQLTFPEDTLDAFRAITTATSRSMMGGILHGLPEMFFDGMLLWQPQNTLERKKSATGLVISILPSWSWAGWVGKVVPNLWTEGHCYQDKERCLILHPVTKWYKSEQLSGIPALIHSTYYETRKRNFEAWEQDHLGSILPKGHTFIHPVPLSLSPLSPDDRKWSPIISCRTRRLLIGLGETLEPVYSNLRIQYYLADHAGNSVGAASPHSREPIGVYSDRSFEWICICAAEADWAVNSFIVRREFPEVMLFHKDCDDNCHYGFGQWRCRADEKALLYKFYFIMAIEWKDGIAYRIGLGRVFRDFWDSAPTKEIDVRLG